MMNWRIEKVCQIEWVKKCRFHFCQHPINEMESKPYGKFAYLQEMAVDLRLNWKYGDYKIFPSF
jgi:hypothetical protein